MVNTPLLSRREFVQILAVAATAYPLVSCDSNPHKSSNSVKNKSEPWLTLSSVQDHLLPQDKTNKDNSPSAKDINALGYLQYMMKMSDFDKEEYELINNGVGWLNDLANQQYSKMFIQLDADDKEKILRRIENSRVGSRWLSVLLTYLIQALLTDPIYGGNPNGMGWAWLQHQPGFPRPPENKKYFKLNKKRYRNIKA